MIVVKSTAVDNLPVYLLYTMPTHFVIRVHFSVILDLLFQLLVISFKGGCIQSKINLETYFASISSLISFAKKVGRGTRARRY